MARNCEPDRAAPDGLIRLQLLHERPAVIPPDQAWHALGAGLLAHVLVDKYAGHLLLYRQSQIFGCDGLDLDRSTLPGWAGKSTALLAPLAESPEWRCQ